MRKTRHALANPASRPASKTASQRSPARKHTVFDEADLGSQVFLEATFSEREHLQICEERGEKKLPEFSPGLFSLHDASRSIGSLRRLSPQQPVAKTTASVNAIIEP